MNNPDCIQCGGRVTYTPSQGAGDWGPKPPYWIGGPFDTEFEKPFCSAQCSLDYYSANKNPVQ